MAVAGQKEASQVKPQSQETDVFEWAHIALALRAADVETIGGRGLHLRRLR
jgi:hypothetical protein